MKSYIILHKMIHRLIEGQINKLKTKVKQSRTQLKLTLRLIFSWYGVLRVRDQNIRNNNRTMNKI